MKQHTLETRFSLTQLHSFPVKRIGNVQFIRIHY